MSRSAQAARAAKALWVRLVWACSEATAAPATGAALAAGEPPEGHAGIPRHRLRRASRGGRRGTQRYSCMSHGSEGAAQCVSGSNDAAFTQVAASLVTGDMNGDAAVTVGEISPFVACLLTGGCP